MLLRLTEIQSRIFDLGAATATPQERSTANRVAYTAVNRALYHMVQRDDKFLVLFAVPLFTRTGLREMD